jgi:hypothetical protein
MMVHVAVHWPSNDSDNIHLWPFAVQHAVWLFNQIPNRVTGLSPLEVFTKTKSDHCDLQRAHVWGCPVFVLDPLLQDGKKIPKWNRRAWLAQFVGFSPEHLTLVANVRHLQTNHVSPQFHLIHDDNTSKQFLTTLHWIIRCLMTAFLISLSPLLRFTPTLNNPRTVLLSTHRLLSMTFGLMKASIMRSALRLLRSVLMLVIIGDLKQSTLQSLSLLFRCLTFLFPTNNVRPAPWSPMMSLPVLLSLLMIVRLFLLLCPTPFLLRLVVVVSDPGKMRELLLVVHAKAKG